MQGPPPSGRVSAPRFVHVVDELGVRQALEAAHGVVAKGAEDPGSSNLARGRVPHVKTRSLWMATSILVFLRKNETTLWTELVYICYLEQRKLEFCSPRGALVGVRARLWLLGAHAQHLVPEPHLHGKGACVDTWPPAPPPKHTHTHTQT